MKTSKFKTLSVVILLAAFNFLQVYSANEATRVYEKLFPVTGQASLEIENRYGSIDVRNWEKDDISIKVVVTVTHSSKETAEKQLSFINIDFSQHENSVSAITSVDQRISRMGSRWFSSGDNESGINIEYTVYAPKETDLMLSHRYGDIFIDEAAGHTFIDLRYGNLHANNIIRDNTRPLSEINLAYSTKATISNAEWIKVNMRYSDLTVDQCRAIVITSSYSKLRVDRASSIVSESRYGEFNLGHITNLVAESAYTNYTIKEINKTLDVESRYGNVRVDNVPSGFTKLRFISSYGNMRIGVDSDASYRIESTANYGSVNIPPSGRVEKQSRGRESTISGIVGRNTDPGSLVEITTRYGNVDLTAR